MKYRVLIVDDNENNIFSLKMLLEMIDNVKVFEADSGEAGLEIALKTDLDLILLDVQMPNMNGFEVAKFLKMSSKTSKIPVIFVTAVFKEEEFKKRGFDLGAVDYLTKPIEDIAFLNKIKLYFKLFDKEKELKELNNSLKEQVKAQTLKLTNQNEKLIDYQKHLTQNIEYSSMIQSSILPTRHELDSNFDDYFVIWEPKDIVSGDLYFFKKLSTGFILVVADCTGHGVSGAFMTMMLKSVLDSVISRNLCFSPSDILKRLNRKIKKLLNQTTTVSSIDSGLDAGVIVFDNVAQKLLFSGAQISLFTILNDSIKYYKADKASIGYRRSNFDYEFKTHSIGLNERYLYLTTDGLIDQLGGVKSLPFGKRRLKKILLENYKKDFKEQKEIILNEFENYMGDEDRLDDVTLFGFKI